MGRSPSSMNAPDAVALADRVEDEDAGDDAPEDRVSPVEVRLRGMRDEILAAPGVRTRERHADPAGLVAYGIDLVAQHESRPTPAVAARIAVLHDEVRHHAMPPRSVEIAALHETHNRRDRERRLGGEQLDVERAAVRLQKDVRV